MAGLFTGAVVGTEAYAAYVNAQGGVNGRKLVVQSTDDQFAGATITPRGVMVAIRSGLDFFAANKAKLTGGS